MSKLRFFLSVTMLLWGTVLSAQQHYFNFKFTNRQQIDSISNHISIDKVKNDTVWAYANNSEMQWFVLQNIAYQHVEEYGSKGSKADMATDISQMESWNKYPTYELYELMMQDIADTYKSLCRLEEIATLASGRRLLALKISADAEFNNRARPEILLASSIHGNENSGYVLALRMANHLVTNYNVDAEITRLLDSTEIWICPLANPDGTFNGGNSTFSGYSRYNANKYDLNRNYPVIGRTINDKLNVRQEETAAFIEFDKKHHFNLSVHLHEGNEVFNYPWDTWERRAADDDWWKYVGGNYRDTVHKYRGNETTYFDGLENGITNGYDWYSVNGGCQDYRNYYRGCREVTVEISNTKTVSSKRLPVLWEYQHRSLLNFMAEALNGVRGLVVNEQGKPLAATVTVNNHDTDNSYVTTDARVGDYYRYLIAGEYDITFSADGYISKTEHVVVENGKPTWLNVVLEDQLAQLNANQLEFDQPLFVGVPKIIQLQVSNTGLFNAEYSTTIKTDFTKVVMAVTPASGTILVDSTVQLNVTFVPNKQCVTTSSLTINYGKKLTFLFNLSVIDTTTTSPDTTSQITPTDTTIVSPDTTVVVPPTDTIIVPPIDTSFVFYNKPEARVYPNPFSHSVKFEFSEPVEQIEVFDAVGQIVFEQKGPTRQVLWLTSNIKAGVYIYRYTVANGNTFCGKIISATGSE